MNQKKFFITFIILLFFIYFLHSELKFEPVALNIQDMFLFNSVEIIAGNQYNRTLFYGTMKDEKVNFDAVSFYPENFYYSSNEKKLFIQNRMGLYSYDLSDDVIKPVEMFPNYVKNDEYVIY